MYRTVKDRTGGAIESMLIFFSINIPAVQWTRARAINQQMEGGAQSVWNPRNIEEWSEVIKNRENAAGKRGEQGARRTDWVHYIP